MQRFTDQDVYNHDDLDVSNARPRAPTPSALPPSFQYSPNIQSPSSYAASLTSTIPHVPPVPPVRGHAHTSSTTSTRARSQSVSAGQSSTPSHSSVPSPTAPLSLPNEYATDSHPVPPTTPPPHTFARPAKYSHPSYADPAAFPTPPSYPPVPGLMACGSSSTSTRSSAYTSPGASAPLSSNDLSTLGIGLGKFANREDDHDSPYMEDDAVDMGAAITTDKPVLPHPTSYHRSLVRESSESSISRLQFAANTAAVSAANGNGVSLGWSEGYAPSTLSGSSSYEGAFYCYVPFACSITAAKIMRRPSAWIFPAKLFSFDARPTRPLALNIPFLLNAVFFFTLFLQICRFTQSGAR